MAVTQTELKSSFLKDVLNEEEYQSNIQSVQDWLTSQTQAASSVYSTEKQIAAKQASYDISGAYANYLKQQRNITSQGRLETGYKEELGDATQQQFQGAYSQAKTAQAQTVADAQASYLKNVQSYQETASKAAASYYESALKEAELRANIYKAAEEYAKLGDSTFAVYNIDSSTGKHTLTDWGYEQLSGSLLSGDGFKTYLEEQKMKDELEYYLSDTAGTHERLFGITETKYDASSQEAIGRRIRTEGYIETIQKPYLDINSNDFMGVDFGQKGEDKIKTAITNVSADDSTTSLAEYAKSLGLSEEETIQIVKNYYASNSGKSAADTEKQKFANSGTSYNDLVDMMVVVGGAGRGDTLANELNDILSLMATASKTKYKKE